MKVRFLLVEGNTPYNVLIGRPCLNSFRTIVLTPHLTMKYPSDKGAICTVKADQKVAKECYMAGLKVEPLVQRCKTQWSEVAMADLDP